MQIYSKLFFVRKTHKRLRNCPEMTKVYILSEMGDPLSVCAPVSKLKYSAHHPPTRKYRSRWDAQKKPQTYLGNTKFYRTDKLLTQQTCIFLQNLNIHFLSFLTTWFKLRWKCKIFMLAKCKFAAGPTFDTIQRRKHRVCNQNMQCSIVVKYNSSEGYSRGAGVQPVLEHW